MRVLVSVCPEEYSHIRMILWLPQTEAHWYRWRGSKGLWSWLHMYFDPMQAANAKL